MILPSSSNGRPSSRSRSDAHVDAYRSTGSSPGSPGSSVGGPGSSLGGPPPSPGRAGRTRVTIPTDFHGSVDVEIPWEEHGPSDGPAVVVLGGISAGRHLLPTALDPSPGWWPGVVGAGRPLDPARLRLVGVDFLDGGSWSGPATTSADTIDRSRAGPVTTDDQARAVAAALDGLGARAATIVGASYGGMVALAFAVLFPERTRRLVVICSAHRSHPLATAWRSIQRSLVRIGEDVDRADDALVLARGLAMTTYRSARELESRFDGEPVVTDGWARFPVESYLEARGRDFASRFRPDRFLRLSESIDLHAVDPARVASPTTAVSFDTDTLVPPWLVDELVLETGGPCRHVRLSSIYGHDAFLKESERLADVLRGIDVGREDDR